MSSNGSQTCHACCDGVPVFEGSSERPYDFHLKNAECLAKKFTVTTLIQVLVRPWERFVPTTEVTIDEVLSIRRLVNMKISSKLELLRNFIHAKFGFDKVLLCFLTMTIWTWNRIYVFISITFLLYLLVSFNNKYQVQVSSDLMSFFKFFRRSIYPELFLGYN